jgi:hypothetical protein
LLLGFFDWISKELLQPEPDGIIFPPFLKSRLPRDRSIERGYLPMTIQSSLIVASPLSMMPRNSAFLWSIRQFKGIEAYRPSSEKCHFEWRISCRICGEHLLLIHLISRKFDYLAFNIRHQFAANRFAQTQASIDIGLLPDQNKPRVTSQPLCR